MTLLLALAQNTAGPSKTQSYLAWLVTPGGDLKFGLDLVEAEPGAWRAFLVNGEERIEVPRVTRDGDQLLLDMPHYDSRIRARVAEPNGAELSGTWEKRRGPDSKAELNFRAGALPETWSWDDPKFRWPAECEELTGRWTARFDDESMPSIAVLGQRGRRLEGTFLTPTGDFRYLAGQVGLESETSFDLESPGSTSVCEVTFELSCFDGAHAFLFKGRLAEGRILGDFWSGDWHHQTWSAERDDSAQLTDPFAQTKWNGAAKLGDLAFPDLDGTKRSLGDFAGKATLLVVLGSWCPNCNDEAKLLRELDAKYRERGLRILGLAFELTGEFARDAGQVRIFAERHGLSIPFFLCGTADKDEATKALGLVDRVRAFPTTVFVGADGLPRAIHSGFAGPATGEEHTELVREFETRIEALLGAGSAPR